MKIGKNRGKRVRMKKVKVKGKKNIQVKLNRERRDEETDEWKGKRSKMREKEISKRKTE